MQRNQLLTIKCCDTQDVYIKSTTPNDKMVDKPAPIGTLESNKPLEVMNYNTYKIPVDKSDQPLAYYLF